MINLIVHEKEVVWLHNFILSSGRWAHCVGARRFIPPILPSSLPSGQWQEVTPATPAASPVQGGPDAGAGDSPVGACIPCLSFTQLLHLTMC